MLAACGSGEVDAPEAVEVGRTLAPLQMAAPDRGIADEYIVVLKPNASPQAVARSQGVSPRFTYSVINGFAARLTPGQLQGLRNNPNVEYIEQDQRVQVDATQSNATWGIDRIDQVNLPLSGTYFYVNSAYGVRAYIIDTGIQSNHPNFFGRATNSFDAFGENGEDCHGHGTHVAGTVGSQTYGVAKGTFLHGVRVLACNGSGSIAGVISGVDWVRNNHIKPAVANMSLGGGFSASLNTAVNSLSDAGVFVAVAAGNNNADACSYSPASAANATTVAASTNTDARASYSNFGGCVDIYAPGTSVTSTWTGGGTSTISGTSMASPHVAGVAALYKSNFGDVDSATLDAWLKANATPNVVSGNPAGTPNKLLYKSSL
jgi:subtilisin family serine protease